MSNKTFDITPSVLSFYRSIDTSNGVFFNILKTGEKTPLNIYRHGIRCTQNIDTSSTVDTSTSTNAKERDVRNLQVIETAFSSHDAKAIYCEFSLNFRPLEEALHSIATGKVEKELFSKEEIKSFIYDIRKSINEFLKRAMNSEGFDEVCCRYARSIANAGWLWRNRVKAMSVITNVEIRNTSKELLDILEFDSLSISNKDFNNYSSNEKKLSSHIKNAFKGQKVYFVVSAVIDFGYNQNVEIFPSQEYVPASNKDKNFPSRKLYYVNPVEPQASFRNDKISNAIRTIDTWYDGDNAPPIPVEPMGANLDKQEFLRENNSAFKIIKRLNTLDPNTPDGMFMIASLIRGGVY